MNKPSERNTMQKSIVLETVRSMQDHPTADMVYDKLHGVYPTISKATVYRILGQLSAKGEIRKIAVSDGADRYDFKLEPHYHVKCLRCGAVGDVFMKPIAELETPQKYINTVNGFEITGSSLIFEGICDCCKK